MQMRIDRNDFVDLKGQTTLLLLEKFVALHDSLVDNQLSDTVYALRSN